MDELAKVMEERREKALEVLDQIEWKNEPVKCDDMGDTYYRWHTTYWIGTDYIWEDYWHNEPDDTQIYNSLLVSVKDGSLGDTIADYLGEEENYNKMLDERRKK